LSAIDLFDLHNIRHKFRPSHIVSGCTYVCVCVCVCVISSEIECFFGDANLPPKKQKISELC
jgi:hypothetical protein